MGRRWRSGLGVLLLALLLAPPLRSEPRAPALTLDYDVFTGGLQIVELAVDLLVDRARYDVVARMRTRGVYGTLFPWEAQTRASGRIDAVATAAPLLFEQRGVFRGRARSVEITYGAAGIADVAVIPGPTEDFDREPVPMEALAGVTDPLNGIVALLLRVQAGAACAGTQEGFDGRRRFRIDLADRGMEGVDSGRAGSFAGRARGCDFIYRQVGGFARRAPWGNDRQREAQTGRFWLAATPRDAIPLPVRFEVDGHWGRSIAHLRLGLP